MLVKKTWILFGVKHFGLAWDELKEYIGTDIQFDNNASEILPKLNERSFSKDIISEKDYYIKVAKLDKNSIRNLKSDITKELYKKFKISKSDLIDNIDISDKNGIFIYTFLKKHFTFLEKFDDLNKNIFTDIEGKENEASFFGINENSDEKLTKNVEILYYKDYYSFIIKLKTKEDEEVILYKTEDINKYSLDELYNDVIKLSNEYKGKKELGKDDILSIPYINLNILINYDELCNKEINGTGEYIAEAIQDINFLLTNSGGEVNSEASITTDLLSCPPTTAEYYEFNSPFVIFIKEKDKDRPYLMTKILDMTFLNKG